MKVLSEPTWVELVRAVLATPFYAVAALFTALAIAVWSLADAVSGWEDADD